MLKKNAVACIYAINYVIGQVPIMLIFRITALGCMNILNIENNSSLPVTIFYYYRVKVHGLIILIQFKYFILLFYSTFFIIIVLVGTGGPVEFGQTCCAKTLQVTQVRSQHFLSLSPMSCRLKYIF